VSEAKKSWLAPVFAPRQQELRSGVARIPGQRSAHGFADAEQRSDRRVKQVERRAEEMLVRLAQDADRELLNDLGSKPNYAWQLSTQYRHSSRPIECRLST
jgi:hypothetical protein